MENNKSTQKQEEEIDLGDLFRYLKNGFNKLGNTALHFINFLLKNALLLIILIVIGAVIGYFLEKNTKEIYKTEAVVATGFGSAEYLYGAVNEVNFKFKKQNQAFLDKLQVENFDGFSLEVKPVVSLDNTTNEQQNFYDLIRESELLDQESQRKVIATSFEKHNLILYHPTDAASQKILKHIIEYLRDNEYYQAFHKDYLANIESRITENKLMIRRIDSLVGGYTKSLKETPGAYQQLQYYNADNSLDLGEVLANRLTLQRENRNLIQDRSMYSNFLNIIKIGSPKELENKGISSNYIVIIPFVLILLFFVFILLQIVFRKARALKN